MVHNLFDGFIYSILIMEIIELCIRILDALE